MRSLALAWALSSIFVAQGQDIDRAVRLLQDQGFDSASEYVNETGNMTLYAFGMDVIARYSLDDAVSWYQNLYEKSGKLRYLNGKAWIHWVRGEADLAGAAAREVLDQNPSDLQAARAHYVLAYVTLSAKKTTAAREHAETSLAIYRRLGKQRGMFVNYLLLAHTAVKERNFPLAESFLETAEKQAVLAKVEQGRKDILELRVELCWQQHLFQEAAMWAEACKLEQYRSGDIQGGWAMNARLGIILAMLGRVEEARKIAYEMDALAKGPSGIGIRIPTQILWIYLSKCDNVSYTIRKAELMALDGFDAGSYGELLAFLEGAPCPYQTTTE